MDIDEDMEEIDSDFQEEPELYEEQEEFLENSDIDGTVYPEDVGDDFNPDDFEEVEDGYDISDFEEEIAAFEREKQGVQEDEEDDDDFDLLNETFSFKD